MAETGTPRQAVETVPVRQLAARLGDVEKAVERLGKSANLRNASISGGDGLVVKDEAGNIRLRVSPEEGAILAYNATGAETARYGLLAHSDPGEYGIEALSGGTWIHVGDESVTWDNVGGKPSTFAPSAHTHAGADVTSAVAQAEGSQYGWTNTVGGTEFYQVWVGNNGGYKFGRNTSSIRYKDNVRTFTDNVTDLMQIRTVLYDRKPTLEPPVDEDGNRVEGPEQLWPGRKNEFGLIAEELAEIWPEVITWFDSGDGPVIDGIRYDLIAARLIPVLQGMLLVVRNTRARVKTLEDRAAASDTRAAAQDTLIANLTQRLEALEAQP